MGLRQDGREPVAGTGVNRQLLPCPLSLRGEG